MKNNEKIGKLGEDIVCRYLLKRGFSIVEKNYWKKWGEIDIIAEKSNVLHFIEVKSVSKETEEQVTREMNEYNPEEMVHKWKLKRLSRVIQTYLLKKTYKGQGWRFDIAAVFLSVENKKAYVRYTKNVVI